MVWKCAYRGFEYEEFRVVEADNFHAAGWAANALVDGASSDYFRLWPEQAFETREEAEAAEKLLS